MIKGLPRLYSNSQVVANLGLNFMEWFTKLQYFFIKKFDPLLKQVLVSYANVCLIPYS